MRAGGQAGRQAGPSNLVAEARRPGGLGWHTGDSVFAAVGGTQDLCPCAVQEGRCFDARRAFHRDAIPHAVWQPQVRREHRRTQPVAV